MIGQISPAAFFELVPARRGHFKMESGMHSGLWLNLDALFADPGRVEPFVGLLADTLRPHKPAVVCGPQRGGAVLAERLGHKLQVPSCFTEMAPDSAGDGLYRARYRLPAAFAESVHDRKVALVDDVMSAGSSLRATLAELGAHAAQPVAIGAILVLGDIGAAYFAERGLPVVSVMREPFDAWTPDSCPLCRRGLPLEKVS